MAKAKRSSAFVCSECGEEYGQWQGKCSTCGAWNTLKEVVLSSAPVRSAGSARAVTPQKLSEVAVGSAQRTSTGHSEVDRVLGGGVVAGSVTLIGGDPGIGKSTLLLQVADAIAGTVLYVCGEESPSQVKLRADRLGLAGESLQLLATTDVHAVTAAADELKPALLVIDSIQTLYDSQFPSTPGSLVQVRETALRLQQWAKQSNVATFLVGHITKEGTVAGPRTLEHLVDCVLYLEGERGHDLRILRAVKNRFGDASEVGVLSMEHEGLVAVGNPSTLLLAERVPAPGSVLSVVLEGNRPLLVEVQALTTPTVYGYPRRTSSGFDLNRLNLLLAVLQRRAGIDLSSHDVYVNVVGGLKVKDPGLDLAVCAALASAASGAQPKEHDVWCGEVGLGGEVRKPSRFEQRSKEVAQLGYELTPHTKQLREALGVLTPKKG